MIYAAFASDASRDACNEQAHALGIDPEGTLSTFCVPLVSGTGPDYAPPMLWACCGMINDQGAEWVETSDELLWWKWDAQTRELLASHDGLHLGETWGFGKCLASAGVKRQHFAPQ